MQIPFSPLGYLSFSLSLLKNLRTTRSFFLVYLDYPLSNNNINTRFSVMLVPGRVYCIVQENYTALNSSKWGYDTPNTFIFPLRFLSLSLRKLHYFLPHAALFPSSERKGGENFSWGRNSTKVVNYITNRFDIECQSCSFSTNVKFA